MQTSSLRFLVVFQNLSFASCLSQFPVNRPPTKPRCTLRCHFLPTSIRNQLVTLPVSQIIVYWKQRYAADAVQKMARFAAMFGSVIYSHQPRVTQTYRIKAEDNKRHTRLQPRQFTERTTAVQLLDTESGMRRERETRESSTIHHPTSCQLFPEPIRHFRSIPIYPTQRSSPEGSLVHV